MGIVCGVFNERGHDEPFVGPVPLVGMVGGVSDVDAVVEGVLGVIGDESWRRGKRLVFWSGSTGSS